MSQDLMDDKMTEPEANLHSDERSEDSDLGDGDTILARGDSRDPAKLTKYGFRPVWDCNLGYPEPTIPTDIQEYLEDGTPTGAVAPPKETYDVFLSAHRGELSLGENRRRLGFSAYHWAILLVPKKEEKRRCYAFDITNGVNPDALHRRNLNTDFKWLYCMKSKVNPASSDSLLIRVAIGQVRDGHPEDIHAMLGAAQLPAQDVRPPEDCVSWIRSALHALRRDGHAVKIDDVDMVMSRALAYADSRMADPANAPSNIDYLGNELVLFEGT